MSCSEQQSQLQRGKGGNALVLCQGRCAFDVGEFDSHVLAFWQFSNNFIVHHDPKTFEIDTNGAGDSGSVNLALGSDATDEVLDRSFHQIYSSIIVVLRSCSHHFDEDVKTSDRLDGPLRWSLVGWINAECLEPVWKWDVRLTLQHFHHLTLRLCCGLDGQGVKLVVWKLWELVPIFG